MVSVPKIKVKGGTVVGITEEPKAETPKAEPKKKATPKK